MRKPTPRPEEESPAARYDSGNADPGEVSLPADPVASDPPTSSSLIWPPPEDELDGWEVLQLRSSGHTVIEPMRYTPEGLVPLDPPAAPAPPESLAAPVPASEPIAPPAPPAPSFASGPMRRPAAVPPTPVPAAARVEPERTAFTQYAPPPSSDATPAMAWPAVPPADSELPETQVIEPLMLRSVEPSLARASDPPTEPKIAVPVSARPPHPRPSLVPPPLREPDPDDTNPALMTRVLPVPNFAKGPRPLAPPPPAPASLSDETRISMEDTLPASIPRSQLPPPSFAPPPPAPSPVPPTAGDLLIRPVTTGHRHGETPAVYVPAPEPVPYAPPAPAPVPVPASSQAVNPVAQPGDPVLHPVTAAPPVLARPAASSHSQFWKLAVWLVALSAIVLVGYLVVRTLSPSAAGPTTATVVIDSTPPGAEVLIDGQVRGKTPFREELAPGTHRLELRAGSASRATELTLQAGTLSSHTFEFAAPPAAGDSAIEVRSDPPGARVVIGGVARGVTPIVVTGLAAGRHEVQVSGPFRPVTRSVTVSAGQQALLVITPARTTPAPADPAANRARAAAPAAPARDAAAARQGNGYISIESPLVLRVVRNGEFLGTSDDARLPLPAGSHVIGLENESVGFREVRTVEVIAGRTATVSVGLPQGTLNINARPWAEVFVDGQRVGETPVSQLALPIGAHEIVFRHPEHGERRVTTVVRVGSPGRAFVDFTK